MVALLTWRIILRGTPMSRSCFAASFLISCVLSGAEPTLALKPGDRVALIGDSITAQKNYTRYVEIYLLTASGVADLDVAQFGWPGERASDWAGRWRTSTAWFKPNVVTTCYGMNDGAYRSFTPDIGDAYRQATTTYVTAMKSAGVRELVIGSPGVVDTTTFRNPTSPAVYNDNLGQLGLIGRGIAEEQHVRSADLHQPLLGAMTRAKAAYGADYPVAGGDGVHADENGHLVMAGALLQALGCDGAIACITFGADGTASASAGHAVVHTAKHEVELASTRWPFVLMGDGKAPTSNRSIAPFTDFIERLDRFVVVMPSCTWAKATITWGSQSVTINGAQLKAGVNLMALFTITPFDQANEDLWNKTFMQQEFERHLVQEVVCQGNNQGVDARPAATPEQQQVIAQAVAERTAKVAAVRAVLQPLHHRIALAEAR